MNTPFISSTRVNEARALLASHRAKLEKVIAEDVFVCTTNLAERLLGWVAKFEAKPDALVDDVLSVMGPNAGGRKIDEVVKDAELQKQIARDLKSYMPKHKPSERRIAA